MFELWEAAGGKPKKGKQGWLHSWWGTLIYSKHVILTWRNLAVRIGHEYAVACRDPVKWPCPCIFGWKGVKCDREGRISEMYVSSVVCFRCACHIVKGTDDDIDTIYHCSQYLPPHPPWMSMQQPRIQSAWGIPPCIPQPTRQPASSVSYLRGASRVCVTLPLVSPHLTHPDRKVNSNKLRGNFPDLKAKSLEILWASSWVLVFGWLMHGWKKPHAMMLCWMQICT